MKYNKETLLKATAAEFFIAAILSICLIDSVVHYKIILFCLIVSIAWLTMFCLANEFVDI